MVKTKSSPVSGLVLGASVKSDVDTRLESFLDSEGHISLKTSDYQGIGQEKIEQMLSSLPYEVAAIFSPNGELIHILSDWKEDGSTFNGYLIDDAIHIKGDDGTGYVFFHNHPKAGMPTFSPTDIYGYRTIVRYGPLGDREDRYPTVFVVKAQNGQRYKLEVSDASRAAYIPISLLNGYLQEVKEAQAYAKSHFDGKVARAEYMNEKADTWLKQHASEMGFKYTSPIK